MTMPVFSKEEQELIDRLKASGHPVDHEQLDAPFRFMIRPFTTAGTASLELASWFEKAIFKAVSGMTFESPITGIVIFPKIFDRTVAEPPEDHLTYKENEKSVFVGVNIDYSAWECASREEKLKLLADNLKTSLERIPDIYLTKSDSKKLLLAVENSLPHLMRRLLQ
jgi:hypothetical protein